MPNKKIAIYLTKEQFNILVSCTWKIFTDIEGRRTSCKGYNSWKDMLEFKKKLVETHNSLVDFYPDEEEIKNKKLDPSKIPHFEEGDNL
ncbi:MAG: hypothetical protein PHN88_02905 [Ignavibacteria bacterium]|nr:hypothetical protein [Ignavibacteria bacterium]